jgi:hypothetical protein
MAQQINEAMLAAAVAKFLKNASQTAEQEIIKKLKNSIANGKIRGHETFTAAVNVTAEKIDLNVTIYTKLEL